MPLNDLIIALSRSTLSVDPAVLPQLWQADKAIPGQVFDQLLTALEASPDEHPELLHLLLAECGPAYTVDVPKNSPSE